jgi:glycosyltransferase involved in cell wall biosynthesis
LEGFFEILAFFSRQNGMPWRAIVAGDSLDAEGRALVERVRERFQTSAWWPAVQWAGWIEDIGAFFAEVDILICPSSEFDPFPTVLLEAARMGVAVVAAKVGGIPEIVVDRETGWLFQAGNWEQAALILARVFSQPEKLRCAAERARERMNAEYTLAKMVANYSKLYSSLSNNV